MILFYSDSCQHCSVLLDTIKRHDTKKTIKLVCIDGIVNKINHKINAVPALMFIPSKEIIYGKAVFDYLLLPNRGYLFTSNSTREKTEVNTSIISPIPLNTVKTTIDEPSAFTLGSISADNYSDITDDNINSMNINADKLYKWGIIDDDKNEIPNMEMSKLESEKTQKKLPSIDELQKQRENIFKDI
jgi:ABC-type antimicrobial peptide transport system permease subunit